MTHWRQVACGFTKQPRGSVEVAWRKCWSTVLLTMLHPLTTAARRSCTFSSWRTSFLQQRKGRWTPSVTRCYPRDRRPCCSTGRPMDVSGQICKMSRSVSLVWRCLVRCSSETSQRWASSIPSWRIPWAPRLLRSSCSSRATWVRYKLSDKRRLYQREWFWSCRPQLMLPRIKPWF